MPAIACHRCNQKTKTVAPIFVKRLNYNRFCVYGVCADCEYTKYKFLNNVESRMLPEIFYSMNIPGFALNKITQTVNKGIDVFPLVDPIIN